MRATGPGRGLRLVTSALAAAVMALPVLPVAADPLLPRVTKVEPSSGPYFGGTSVTITGQGFTGVTAVKFGTGVSPSFHLDTDTLTDDTITAVSPAQPAPGPAPVTIWVGNQSSSPESATFTYFEGGWTSAPPMSSYRAGQGATLLKDGSVLVDTCATASNELYAPLGCRGLDSKAEPSEIYGALIPGGPVVWRTTGQPMVWRTDQTSTLLADGTVLVAGGRRGVGNSPFDSAEVYDPATAAWTPTTGRMVSARNSHGAVLLSGPACQDAPPPGYCGRVLVVGGQGSEGVLATAELYDPSTGTWQLTGQGLHVARRDHTTTLLADGRVLVTGGRDRNNVALASAEVYDPAHDEWTLLPARLQSARFGHRAVAVLHDDHHRVLVVGGMTIADRVLASAEVFDPVTGRWTASGSMGDARFGHSLTALPDGRVLAAGGKTRDDTKAPLDSAELWDPGTGRWGTTGRLGVGRANHSATALPDGKVLVAGGSYWVSDVALPLNSTEVFDLARPVPSVSGLDPATGSVAGGSDVHIKGTFLFGAPMTVRFGEAEATAVTAVSDREIVAKSPVGLGQVNVTVTTPGGTSSRSAASQFTYQPGGWTDTGRLDACEPGTSCGGRAHQNGLVLDPPACHAPTPPVGYPCGKVLLAGALARSFEDGQVTAGEDTFTSASAHFTQADVGRGITGNSGYVAQVTSPNGIITEVVDGTRLRLTGPSPTTQANIPFRVWDSSAQLYDSVAGTWSATAPMIAHRATTLLAQPATFSATLLPDVPGKPAGRVLVAGGCCDANPGTSGNLGTLSKSSAEIYDPAADTWTATGAMGEGRVGHSATVLGGSPCQVAGPPAYCGKVLVAGGLDDVRPANANQGRVIRRSAELYDPLTGAWSPTGSMGDIRAAQSANALANGDVLVVGGTGAGPSGEDISPDEVPRATSEVYHPASGTWTKVAASAFDEKRVLHSATTLDPPFCRTGTPPSHYPCGQVLVVGGAQTFEPTMYQAAAGSKAAALYDPVAGTWVAGGAVDVGRAAHTATLLPDGTVVLIGGYGAGASVEVYDPATMSSRLSTSMEAVRTAPSATLLAADPCGARCGQVLLAGGVQPGSDEQAIPSAPMPTAELFTPAPWVGGLEPASGPSRGGTGVVITGSALGQINRVTFGGAELTIHPCPPAPPVGGCFTVESPTRASAVSPVQHAGAVEVAATAPLWPEESSPRGRGPQFTYVPSALPGAVTDLRAEATSDTSVRLTFSAVPSDGLLPPPAARYAIRQARSPITNDAGFDAATDLCPQACAFEPAAVGAPLTLAVSGLKPGRTYHYALRAMDSGGQSGSLSNPASAMTTGPPPACPDLFPAATGQVVYPAGYSLVGLPGGTTPIPSGRYFGWFDQPAGGRYSERDAPDPAEAGHGYWAWSPCPHVVNLAKPGLDEVSLALGAYHASLVANPSAAGPVTVSGYDYAARWDPALNDGAGGYRYSALRQPLTLDVGQGMWVFSYTASIITIHR